MIGPTTDTHAMFRAVPSHLARRVNSTRHKQTKHNQLPPHKYLRCPESGCKYAPTPHFKRKDNLTDHLKRMHNYGQADAKAKADSQAISQAKSHFENQAGPQPTPASRSHAISKVISTPTSISSPPAEATPQQDLSWDSARIDTLVPGPSKKRRLGGSTLHLGEAWTFTRASVEEPNDETEMWKRKAVRFEGELESMWAQNVSLRTQNQSLESEIERLKEKVLREESHYGILLSIRDAASFITPMHSKYYQDARYSFLN